MKDLINRLNEFFSEMLCDPMNTGKHAEELKDILNSSLGSKDNFKPVTCNKVFVSGRNSADPFYIAVIPTMPNTGDSILTIPFLRQYDIDIDIENIISSSNERYGLTAEEVTAWLMHELYQNVLTDTTLLRYKKLFIDHYDTKNKTILAAHNNLGYISWFGVFGNTYKDKINDNTNDPASANLKLLELNSDWNTALLKFIYASGGDPGILVKSKYVRDDKIRLDTFNRLARRYCSYAVKYANRDWARFSNYLCAEIGSECLKYYIRKEPELIAAVPEREEFKDFDSMNLLYENTLNILDKEDKEIPTALSCVDMTSKVDELVIDVDNVFTMSDKLLTAAKIKDMISDIQTKLEDDPVNEFLQEAKERLYQASKVLAMRDVSAVNELELR